MRIGRLVPLLSALALLAVAPGAAQATTAVAKNKIADAPVLTGPGPHPLTFDPGGATWESGEKQHIGSGFLLNSVWIGWKPSASGGMRLEGCVGGKDNGFRVYKKGPNPEVSVTNLVPLTSAEVPASGCNGADQVVKAAAGETYYIVAVRGKDPVDPSSQSQMTLEQGTTPPKVTFKNPSELTGAKAAFEWTAPNESTFTCELDGTPRPLCTESKGKGKAVFEFSSHATHTLTVVARDRFGNEGPQAAWKFRADGLPPDTAIDSPLPVKPGPHALVFHASEQDGVTFSCRIRHVTDYAACSSPWSAGSLIAGASARIAEVVAYDKWGNADPTPAVQELAVPWNWDAAAAPPQAAPPVEPQQTPIVQHPQAPPVAQPQPQVAKRPVAKRPAAKRRACKARGGRKLRRARCARRATRRGGLPRGRGPARRGA